MNNNYRRSGNLYRDKRTFEKCTFYPANTSRLIRGKASSLDSYNMNRASLAFDAVAIEDTLNDAEAVVLPLLRIVRTIGGSENIRPFSSGCHSQTTSAYGCPPFPLRAFTARHSILHLMVHPSFANRHLDISARRCPVLTNTRICLTFLLVRTTTYIFNLENV